MNRDILMSRVSQRISDKRVLKLIGAPECRGNGRRTGECDRGRDTAGRPAESFVINLLLDEMDKELEKRGHMFVRYAGGSNI